MDWLHTRTSLNLWESAQLLEPNPRKQHEARAALADAIATGGLRALEVHRHEALDEFGNACGAGAIDDMSTLVSAAELRRWCAAHGVTLQPVTNQAPAPPPVPTVVEPVPTGPVLKRAALIKQHEPEWPTIESDLREASRNGLSVAQVASRTGYWNPEAALRWGKEHGKLITHKKSSQWHP